MATINGTTGRNASHWKYFLICTEIKEDNYVSTNSTKLKVDVYLGATSYSRAVRGSIEAVHTINIDGTNYTFTTKAYTIEKNTNYLLGTITSNAITHNDDGSKKVSVTANSPDLAQASGYGPYTGTASGEVELTTIPRASLVTCADGNIGSSTTINIQRATDTFKHTLKYNFGNKSGTIATKISDTSYGWTIPTDFYSQIPNAKSGQGIIICETYNGDTLIGENECTFNATVLEETNKPTITATIVDSNAKTKALTGNENKLIKYFSNAKVTVNATAKNSATIASQKVTCGDGKNTEKTTDILEGVESGTFTLTCTDSRGFPASDIVTKEMINYLKLAITSIEIGRESTTSDTVNVSLKGNYYNGDFSSSTSNSLTLKWRYRVKDGEWSTYTVITPIITDNTFSYSGTLGTNFSYKTAYEFEIVAEDKLMTDPKTKPVDKGIPLVNMGENDIIINGEFKANEFEGKFAGDLTGNVAGDLNGNVTGNVTGNASTATKLNTVVLYNSESGTTGNITLSETAANFEYLEIFYGKSNSTHLSSVKVYNPNQKNANLIIIWRIGDGGIQFQTQRIIIQGSNILRDTEAYFNLYSNSSISVGDQTDIAIFRVDGYR